MPELTSTDVLVGRIALSQGKVTRPQLDQAIAAYRSGQAPSLAHAIVSARFVTTDEMRVIVQTARSQDSVSSSTTASTYGRPAPAPPSPYPPPMRGAPLPPPQASAWSAAAPTLAPGEIPGMASVRQRANPGAAIAPLPQPGTPTHDALRRQYEDYILGRLLVQRGTLADAQLQELLRRQKQEVTQSGQVVPLARTLIRAGLVSPAVIDQLTQEVSRKVFSCPRCGDTTYIEPAPQPQQVPCRKCNTPIPVPSLDGRLPPGASGAPDGILTVADGGGEVTVPMQVPQGGFGAGAAPTLPPQQMFGTAPGMATAGSFGEAPGNGNGGARIEGQPDAVAEWIIEREIGRGGMGVIYLARHRTRGERAALKLMLNAPAASEKKQRRFTREVDAARKLNHPNIVRLLDAGEHEGFPYFAMEYVDGKPLDKLLKEELDLELGMEVLEKLCRGVNYAHDQGIVHRDLKPANVLVDDNMTPKLTDFGLAKSEDHKSVLTKTGAVVGTPYYLSPEQARGSSKDVDHRADIYALGVIMYELITGRLPFVGQTTVELYNRILNDDPPLPTKVKPQLTKEIETVCLKALEKNPDERYQTANELGDDIKCLLSAQPIKARPPGAWKRLKKRLKKKGLGTVLAVGIAVALGVTAASLVWWFWTSRVANQRSLAQAERDDIEKTMSDQAAVVSASIMKGERMIALGNEHDAHAAGDAAVKAGEAMVKALDQSKLDLNKEWIAKYRTDHGPDARRAQAAALVLRARAYFAADDPAGVEKGNRDLDQAAGLDESSPELVCAQAEQSVFAQKINEALDRLKSASNYVAARLLEAKIHLDIRSEPSEALRSIEAALDLLKDDEKLAQPQSLREPWARARARTLAIKALASAQREAAEPPVKSLGFADEAVKLAPDLWETHAARARILVGLGRRVEARDELRKIGDLGKGEFGALLEVADVLLAMRRYDDARDAVDAATQSSTNYSAVILKARIKAALLNMADARADAEQVNSHAQNVKKFWANGAAARRLMALITCVTGSSDDIKQQGQQNANAAKEFDPEGVATKLVFARVMLNPAWGIPNSNLENVDRLLKEASKRHGTDPEVKRLLAMAADVRNFTSAPAKIKESATKAEGADPLAAYPHALLARIEHAMTIPGEPDSEETDREALRALDLERDVRRDEGYYYALGIRKVLKNAPAADAQLAFKRAVYEDPWHAQALHALGVVSEGLGNDSRHLLDAQNAYLLSQQANHRYAPAFESFGLTILHAYSGNQALFKNITDRLDRSDKIRGFATPATIAARAWVTMVSFKGTKADATFQDKVEEIAAIYSAACAMEPGNTDLVSNYADAMKRLAAVEGASADVKALAEQVRVWREDRLNKEIEPATRDATDLARESAMSLQGRHFDEAVEAATKATRRAPWVPEAWLALAQARLRKTDPLGAVAALARGAALPLRDTRALQALAETIRAIRLDGKPLPAADAASALRLDDDAAPITTDARALVSILVKATAGLMGGADAKPLARDAATEAQKLVARNPDLLANVFGRGLAALAAGDHEDAMRELGFVALVGDEKGELHWFHALACARASAAQPSSDWHGPAYADDALDALERALAAAPTPDLEKDATADKELQAVVKRRSKS